MPRYFLTIDNGAKTVDTAEAELGTADDVRKLAVQLAANFAKEPDNLTDCGIVVVTARDSADAAVVTVRLVCQIEQSASSGARD